MRLDVSLKIQIKTFEKLDECDVLEFITAALWDVEAFRDICIYDYEIDGGDPNAKLKSDFPQVCTGSKGTTQTDQKRS